ncbi:Synaptonemal complex protein [Schistosoma japonicum]|nr:Synaptonemal complex protein [Schistosoma japonicum]
MRDIIICIGNAIDSCQESALKQTDLLLSISDTIFERSYKSNKNLSETLLKNVLDGILEPLAKLSTSIACNVIRKFLVRMLKIVLDNTFDLVGRFDGFQVKRETVFGMTLTSNFGSSLRNLGDFDLQAHSSALLLRLVPREIQKQFASKYIIHEFPIVAQEFSNIGGVNFEFLGYPETPNVKGDVFWLDFNLDTNRITSYCLAPSNQDSQFSDSVSRNSCTWEILTIYPELLDCLDIRLETGVIVVRFTMTEPIKDICEWAKSVSGYVIEARITTSALSKNFFQLKFTSSSSVVDDNEEANLVCILKRLQSLRQFINYESIGSSTHSETRLPVKNRSIASIATSPISVHSVDQGISTHRKMLSKLIEICTPKRLKKSSNSYQSSVACSPILCNSKLCPSVTNNEELQTHIHMKKDKVSPLAKDAFYDSLLTSVGSVHKRGSPTKNLTTTESYFQTLSNEKIQETSCLIEFTALNKSLEVDLDKSTPEKPRKALLQTSPIVLLNRSQSPIKVDFNDFDARTPEDTKLNYIEVNVSTDVLKECVDKLSSVTSTRAICKISEINEDFGHFAKITKEPQILIQNLNSSVLDIPSPIKSLKSDSLLAATASEKRNDSNSCVLASEVLEPDISLSQSSILTEDSVDQNGLTNSSYLKRLTSKPKYKSSLLTGRSFCTPANQSLSVSTKTLCNISASYLLDISPDEVRCPLTPEEYTENQIKDKTLHKLDKPIFSSNSILTSSLESSDTSDADYQPLSVRLELAPTERRRSARLLNKKEAVTRSDMGSSQIKQDISSRTPTQSPLSSTSQSLTKTPINIPRVIKPVSTFKKKKFFCTSRSERIEKEKQRFQNACEISNAAKNTLKPNKKRLKDKNQRNKEVKVNRQRNQQQYKSKHLPTMKQAVNKAALPHSMPIDSDQDFNVEIVDPDVEIVHKHNESLIFSPVKSTKLSEKPQSLCTKSYNKKLIGLFSPLTDLERTDSNNQLSSSQPSDTSSAASLFTMTPLKHFPKSFGDGKRIKIVPLTVSTSVNQTNCKNSTSSAEKLLLEENSWDKDSSVFDIVGLQLDKPHNLNEKSNVIIEQFFQNSFDRSPLPENMHNNSSKEPELCSLVSLEALFQHVALISTKVDENILAMALSSKGTLRFKIQHSRTSQH